MVIDLFLRLRLPFRPAFQSGRLRKRTLAVIQPQKMCQSPFKWHRGPQKSSVSPSRDGLMLAECWHPKCRTSWGQKQHLWHQVSGQHLESLLLPVTHWDGLAGDKFPFSECLTKVSEPCPFSCVGEVSLVLAKRIQRVLSLIVEAERHDVSQDGNKPCGVGGW